MIGWEDRRCMILYTTLHQIRSDHAVHSEVYAICSDLMDKVEMLDDEIKASAGD